MWFVRDKVESAELIDSPKPDSFKGIRASHSTATCFQQWMIQTAWWCNYGKLETCNEYLTHYPPSNQVQQQVENKVVAQLSQHDSRAVQNRIPALSKANAGILLMVLSEWQPLMFAPVDKLGCKNDMSLGLFTTSKGKLTFGQLITQTCHLPVVSLHSLPQVLTLLEEIILTICHKGEAAAAKTTTWGVRPVTATDIWSVQ